MSDPLLELRCHCEDDVDGHPLGAARCSSEVQIKTRPITPFSAGSTSTSAGPVRGTCRECGQRTKVVRVENRAPWDEVCPRQPGESKAAHQRRRIADFGHAHPGGRLLQAMPAIAPHEVSSKACPGAGQVPAETRYTPGRALAEWTKAHSSDAVA